MERIRRQVEVPHAREAMFDLVADVGSYPEFLPWCAGARSTPLGEEEGDPVVAAGVQIARGPIRYWFTTRNRLHRPDYIRMTLLEGPFRHLSGVWRFEPAPEGGTGSLVTRALGGVFREVGQAMVNAFVARAESLAAPPP